MGSTAFSVGSTGLLGGFDGGRRCFGLLQLVGSRATFFGAVFEEGVHRFMEGALAATFLAADGIVVAVCFIESADGEHGAGGRIFVRGGFGLMADFERDAGGFESPEATHAPVVDGHDFDEMALGVVGRAEVGEEGVEVLGETVGGLFLDEDGLGEDGVATGVEGGVAFALFGFWTGGFLGVEAVGGEFAFRRQGYKFSRRRLIAI